MRRLKRIICYAMIIMCCQVVMPVGAVTEGQENAIKDHCDTIKESLRLVQRDDSRARVYLGGYYENILTKYITPLNVKLVESNLSNASFVENQNKFATTRGAFATDFVNYQKGLEELTQMDCKVEPGKFYEKLVSVRKKRKVVEQDVKKMREIITEHVKLVEDLRKDLQ